MTGGIQLRLLAVQVGLLIVSGSVLAELNVPAKLANEKNISASAVRGRLSKKGVQYMSEVLTNALIPEVVNADINLDPQTIKAEDQTVNVSHMKIKRNAANAHKVVATIQPPDLVIVTMSNVNVVVSALLSDEAGLNLTNFNILSPATTIKLHIHPTITTHGAPNLKIKNCELSENEVKHTYDEDVADSIKTALSANARTLFEGLLCARIEFVVEDRVNDRFGMLPTKITLAHINDDELVRDVAAKLMARRQRRQNPFGHLGTGMNLPFGMNMGAGLGRKKREAEGVRYRRSNPFGQIGTGMTLPFGMNMGAGLGRKKREADDADSVEVEQFRREKRHINPYGQLGAGMRLPFGMNMGAGLGRRKRAAEPAETVRQRRDAAVISSFNVSHMDALFLDYALLGEPRITPLGIEVESSGEVSLRGRGGTPFGPIYCALPETVHEDYMLQMIVSDYMPNSLMYHGHTIGLFKTRVDHTTPHFGAIMRTSCSLSSGMLFCLGDLFPTLRKVHPDRKLALTFNTLQAPVILFRPAASGGINFSLLGRIAIMVVNPNNRTEEVVAEMKIDVDALMKMRLSSSMVRPKIQLDHVKLETMSPGILLQNELDDAVLLTREVLQRMVNDLLKDGIPIPVHPLLRLVKPKVKVVERALLLQTNLEMNEELLRQLTAGELTRRRRF